MLNLHVHEPISFSHLDGSARKIDGIPKSVGPGRARHDPEVADTCTRTNHGLVLAQIQSGGAEE